MGPRLADVMAPRHPRMSTSRDMVERSANSAIEIGAAIREARKSAGMTQADLAKRAGVSRAFLIDIEKGARQRAELSQVRSLFRTLDLSLTARSKPAPTFEQAYAQLTGKARDEGR